jgi:hypothetical protein
VTPKMTQVRSAVISAHESRRGSGHSPERLKPSEPLANLVPTGER